MMKNLLCLLVAVVAGAMAFVLLHLFFVATWASLFVWAHVRQPWWLNSGKSVLVSLVVLFLVALVLSMSLPGSRWKLAVAMLLGAGIASTVVLISIGGGNLLALVIFEGLLFMGVAIFLGMAVGAGLSRSPK